LAIPISIGAAFAGGVNIPPQGLGANPEKQPSVID
jgi:hypothetical protein